jgi:hypothetical protein
MVRSNQRQASTRQALNKRPARSAKAPTSVAIVPVSRRTVRRQRRATVAVRKDTTILQTDQGPRAAWSASIPKFQKR